MGGVDGSAGLGRRGTQRHRSAAGAGTVTDDEVSGEMKTLPPGSFWTMRGTVANVELRILGPLEVLDEGGTVALGGPQHQTLIARLLLARGRSVPLDDIIGSLWDGEPPRTARQQVHKLVSAVRRRLPDVVETVEGVGYRIVADDHWFDAEEFAALTDRGAHRPGRRRRRGGRDIPRRQRR
jgi:DNA-binding winged helix-turn-helix (wHTH) protein